MRRLSLLSILTAMLVMIAGGSAQAADKTYKVKPGQRLDWNGAAATAVTNYNYWRNVNVSPLTHTTCNKERTTYCEQVLVEISNPLTPEEIASGEAKVHPVTVWIDGYGTVHGPVNDFDLLVYASDETGARGPRLAGNVDATNTTVDLVTFSVETTAKAPTTWILIDVVYYQVVSGSYKGHIHL